MNTSAEFKALEKYRSESPGPYTPTRSEIVHIIVALHEAEYYARTDGRPSTGKSYDDLRAKLDAIIEADLVEKLWRDAL